MRALKVEGDTKLNLVKETQIPTRTFPEIASSLGSQFGWLMLFDLVDWVLVLTCVIIAGTGGDVIGLLSIMCVILVKKVATALTIGQLPAHPYPYRGNAGDVSERIAAFERSAPLRLRVVSESWHYSLWNCHLWRVVTHRSADTVTLAEPFAPDTSGSTMVRSKPVEAAGTANGAAAACVMHAIDMEVSVPFGSGESGGAREVLDAMTGGAVSQIAASCSARDRHWSVEVSVDREACTTLAGVPEIMIVPDTPTRELPFAATGTGAFVLNLLGVYGIAGLGVFTGSTKVHQRSVFKLVDRSMWMPANLGFQRPPPTTTSTAIGGRAGTISNPLFSRIEPFGKGKGKGNGKGKGKGKGRGPAGVSGADAMVPQGIEMVPAPNDLSNAVAAQDKKGVIDLLRKDAARGGPLSLRIDLDEYTPLYRAVQGFREDDKTSYGVRYDIVTALLDHGPPEAQLIRCGPLRDTPLLYAVRSQRYVTAGQILMHPNVTAAARQATIVNVTSRGNYRNTARRGDTAAHVVARDSSNAPDFLMELMLKRGWYDPRVTNADGDNVEKVYSQYHSPEQVAKMLPHFRAAVSFHLAAGLEELRNGNIASGGNESNNNNNSSNGTSGANGDASAVPGASQAAAAATSASITSPSSSSSSSAIPIPPPPPPPGNAGAGKKSGKPPLGIKERYTMWNAVRRSDLPQVEKIIARNDERFVVARGPDGWTPLATAAENGNTAIVSAICEACPASLLLETNGDDALTALHCAAQRGDTTCVNAILASAARHGVTAQLLDARKSGTLETALMIAAREGHTGAARAIMSHAGPGHIDACNASGLSAREMMTPAMRRALQADAQPPAPLPGGVSSPLTPAANVAAARHSQLLSMDSSSSFSSSSSSSSLSPRPLGDPNDPDDGGGAVLHDGPISTASLDSRGRAARRARRKVRAAASLKGAARAVIAASAVSSSTTPRGDASGSPFRSITADAFASLPASPGSRAITDGVVDDADDLTLRLHAAIRADRPSSVAAVLAKHERDRDAVQSKNSEPFPDTSGVPAICAAASLQTPDVLHVLLGNTACDINAICEPRGRTALHYAVVSESRECVAALLGCTRFKAREVRDKQGMTALHLAVLLPDTPKSEAIISKIVAGTLRCTAVENSSGNMPWQTAKAAGFTTRAAVLKGLAERVVKEGF